MYMNVENIVNIVVGISERHDVSGDQTNHGTDQILLHNLSLILHTTWVPCLAKIYLLKIHELGVTTRKLLFSTFFSAG